jgi:hypothetical protein
MEMLERIDRSSSSEYVTLKRRFQQHQILLQSHQYLSNEQIQLMVDAILTDENLEAQMAHILNKEPSQPTPRPLGAKISHWWSGEGSKKSQKSSPKRLHLPSVADPDFLAELHARLTDQPVYKETAEKIINLASQRLCTKLKRFLNESLANSKDGLAKVLLQEVRRNFANSREEARLRAEAELRHQVRSALANEQEVEGNRYVNRRLDHFLSALKPRIEFVSLSAVLLAKGEAVLVSLMVTSNGN